MIWNEAKECMSRDEIEALQSARLVKQVNRVYHNVEYYRKKMQAADILPAADRSSPSAGAAVPMTSPSAIPWKMAVP